MKECAVYEAGARNARLVSGSYLVNGLISRHAEACHTQFRLRSIEAGEKRNDDEGNV